jgi:hypothetical protein
MTKEAAVGRLMNHKVSVKTLLFTSFVVLLSLTGTSYGYLTQFLSETQESKIAFY